MTPPPTATTPDGDAYERVMSRARLVWESPVAEVWMHSQNAHLDGARPMDVLALRGPDEVLEALDATIAGSYA